MQLKWDRQGKGMENRGKHLHWIVSFYHYTEKLNHVKTYFMPLICFRKKRNKRRRPSMRNSDSF